MIALGLMQPYLFLCFYLSRRESVGGLQLVTMGLKPAGRAAAARQRLFDSSDMWIADAAPGVGS